MKEADIPLPNPRLGTSKTSLGTCVRDVKCSTEGIRFRNQLLLWIVDHGTLKIKLTWQFLHGRVPVMFVDKIGDGLFSVPIEPT